MERENHRLNTVIATQLEIATMNVDITSIMDLIARRALELSYADGATIEIAENDEVVFQAATGLAATHLNYRIKLAECITGLCVTTGQTLYCPDTELDDRINRPLCRQSGLRSILLVPLRFSEQPAVGVLKVFSTKVDAFNEQDTNSLQLMAGLLGMAMHHVSEVHATNQALEADLARHEQLEKELRAELAKEKEIHQQTAHLISQVSHDFRTPLTAIQTSTELLQYYYDRFNPEKKSEIFDRIHNSVSHLTGMLDEMLSIVEANTRQD